MSLALLLPLGLIALAGLIVPLLIHLVRQSDHPLIDFPALRWLRESERPRRRLRFEDRLEFALYRFLAFGCDHPHAVEQRQTGLDAAHDDVDGVRKGIQKAALAPLFQIAQHPKG